MTDICSLCCVAERDAGCAGCTYYTVAEQYRATRSAPAQRPQRHFLIEINPDVEQAVNDTLDLARKGQSQQAWEAMKGLLKKQPQNHLACYGMGTLHALEGNCQHAIRWFDKAIAIYPFFVEAHYNKAVAYQKQVDVGNAIRAYRKVVEIGDPTDDVVRQAQTFLDSSAVVIRQNEGVDLDTYLESQAEFDRAFALMEKGDWLSALARFRASAAKTDRHAPTHGNMGICLAKLGRKAAALAELDRALEISPNYEPALNNRPIVERMEEGKAMDFAPFQRIYYARECLTRQPPPSR
jgi:tetratricopeptide (TPR) repeat protein